VIKQLVILYARWSVCALPAAFEMTTFRFGFLCIQWQKRIHWLATGPCIWRSSMNLSSNLAMTSSNWSAKLLINVARAVTILMKKSWWKVLYAEYTSKSREHQLPPLKLLLLGLPASIARPVVSFPLNQRNLWALPKGAYWMKKDRLRTDKQTDDFSAQNQ